MTALHPSLAGPILVKTSCPWYKTEEHCVRTRLLFMFVRGDQTRLREVPNKTGHRASASIGEKTSPGGDHKEVRNLRQARLAHF